MKFVILTDSTGCPRISPKSEKIDLDETYPYLIKKEYNTSKFWQLSVGNQISSLLLDQTRGYLMNWKPDYIIIGAGIVDVRPEAFSKETSELFLMKGKLSIFNFLINKILFMPKLIKFFNKHRISETQFLKNIISLKRTFKSARIIWLEISCEENYERSRPGVLLRKKKFNNIIKNIIKEDFIEIEKEISENKFFTKDMHHFTKMGHQLIAKKIINHINKIK